MSCWHEPGIMKTCSHVCMQTTAFTSEQRTRKAGEIATVIVRLECQFGVNEDEEVKKKRIGHKIKGIQSKGRRIKI